MFSIADNLQNVRQRIKKSELDAGRIADSVRLLAVTKKQTADTLNIALESGLRSFGESYLNEALAKQADLANLCTQDLFQDIEWHFIGPIQSNKTRLIAEHFDWVQSIDRQKIADRLNDQRLVKMPPLNVCIQVNISDESSKSGLRLEEIDSMAAYISALPKLKLRGLMAIPMAIVSEESSLTQARQAFSQMHQAFTSLQNQYSDIDTLSMGMSSDIEIAIECGSTMIRVGSALFGQR